MKLSEIKTHLKSLSKIGFQLPNGELVPSHFHVTEVGKITKDFIDCGGKVRSENVINFQGLFLFNDRDRCIRSFPRFRQHANLGLPHR